MGSLFSSPKPSQTPAPEKINIQTGQGSTTFGTFDEQGNFVPSPDIVTQLTELSPEQQQLQTGQEQLALDLQGQLGGELQRPRSADEIRGRVPFASDLQKGLPEFRGIDVAGLQQVDTQRGQQQFTGGLPELGQDFGALAQSAEQATFQRGRNLLDPGFEESRTRLAQDLANRGIDVTSRAGQKELDRLERSQGGQLENLALSSVGAGRQEQERLSRLQLGQRGQLFGEQATQAGIGLSTSQLEAQLRAQGLNEQQVAAQVAASQRAQTFGERQSTLEQSLQKQLALSNLEAQQRAQQVAEVQGTGLLGTPFQPTPITSLGRGSTGATPGGAGFDILGKAAGAFAGTF